MSSYMKLTIVGNLGRDPELRYTQAGVPVCNFSVAVTSVSGQGEARTEETTWFRVAAWREQAENCNKYLAKGRQVLVEGTVKTRAYADNAGQPAASLDVTAQRVVFLGSREDGAARETGASEDPFAGDADLTKGGDADLF